MATPEHTSLIQHIDLTLNRLINFKQNLSSKLGAHPANNNDGSGQNSLNGAGQIDANMIKVILEENPAVKQERDSAKFFQMTIIKILDKIIDEHVQKFYQNKEIEKEIMLLIDRLKDAQKNQEDVQRFNENLSKLNTLEAQERARMLTMLGVMQALNQRYTFLEVEKQKTIKAFTEDMMQTLEGVDLRREDGTALTQAERRSFNSDLTIAGIALAERHVQMAESRAEGRSLNEIVSAIDRREPGVQIQRDDNIAGLFLPVYKPDKGNENIVKKALGTQEFQKDYMNLVQQHQAIYGIKDPGQAQFITKKHVGVMDKNPKFQKIIDMSREQIVIVDQRKVMGNKISAAYEKNNIKEEKIDDARAQMLARRANKKI